MQYRAVIKYRIRAHPCIMFWTFSARRSLISMDLKAMTWREGGGEREGGVSNLDSLKRVDAQLLQGASGQKTETIVRSSTT